MRTVSFENYANKKPWYTQQRELRSITRDNTNGMHQIGQ